MTGFILRRWTCRLRIGRRAKRGRVLRLSAGFSVDALAGRRHRLRHGHPSHFKNPRRIPRPNHEHILGRAVAEGVWHHGRALQCHTLRPPTRREHRQDLLYWQWSTLQHLLQVSSYLLSLVEVQFTVKVLPSIGFGQAYASARVDVASKFLTPAPCTKGKRETDKRRKKEEKGEKGMKKLKREKKKGRKRDKRG